MKKKSPCTKAAKEDPVERKYDGSSGNDEIGEFFVTIENFCKGEVQ